MSDLFGQVKPAAAPESRDRVWVSHECGFCGVKGGQYLRHYGIVRCECGRFFWALRPKRGGPLKLFPHPGFYPTQEILAARGFPGSSERGS